MAASTRARIALLFLLLILGAAGGVVQAQEASSFPYTVEIAKTGDADLDTSITALSALVERKDSPPATRVGLRRRIAEDQKSIADLLRSEGYYAAKVTEAVDSGASPTAIRIAIDLGPRFTVDAYRVDLQGKAPLDVLADLALPKAGDPARAPDIAQAEGAVLARLAEKAHPFARAIDQEIVVDHATSKMAIVLKVDPGAPAAFGPLSLSGLEEVERDHLIGQLPWKEGDPYDQKKIDDGRRALGRSGLFSSVVVDPAAMADASGEVPISIAVAERERRSVGVGLRYETDTGFGTEFFWRHRNLFGRAETLDLTAQVAQNQIGAGAQYREKGFLAKQNTLSLGATVKREEQDAYDSRSAGVTAALERPLFEKVSGSAGVGLEALEVDDRTGTNQFLLLSFPFQLRRDTSNDLLDPSSGSRLTAGYTPVLQTTEGVTFHRFQLSAAAYHEVLPEKRLILAARAAFGALIGATLSDVPATWRLYSGGGGSIRGYEYQRVGPLDADRDPVGGRSQFETGIEARIRVTEDIGIVPFFDAGNVYRTATLDFGDRLQYAAGLGLRYYTSFGPIRADIAIPLNRRPGIDDKFQFYISLGQAF